LSPKQTDSPNGTESQSDSVLGLVGSYLDTLNLDAIGRVHARLARLHAAALDDPDSPRHPLPRFAVGLRQCRLELDKAPPRSPLEQRADAKAILEAVVR